MKWIAESGVWTREPKCESEKVLQLASIHNRIKHSVIEKEF